MTDVEVSKSGHCRYIESTILQLHLCRVVDLGWRNVKSRIKLLRGGDLKNGKLPLHEIHGLCKKKKSVWIMVSQKRSAKKYNNIS